MKISIITVCRNSENTIKDTLNSISMQKYVNLEHLVIDGDSNDNTVKIISSHKSHTITLVSEPDEGIYDAMNKGLCIATGDIIGFLNSDDIFADDEVLLRVANAFEANLGIEACFGDLLYVTQDNLKVSRYWKSEPHVKGNFALGWCPAHPTFYIRRTALDRLGKFDLIYPLAADAELIMRYLECGGVKSIYIPSVLVRMRIGGATNRSWCNIFRQNIEILRALKKNSIPHSRLIFVLSKIKIRIRQRWVAFKLNKIL